ncbi:putative niacin/nicotinamide transporter NaiP isoform X2 [Cephus cinctus]|uniref:Niacin/nicotinamide transporter NaiP isoform X2 n=1 Tax=Cephus cinctus TaxID=211228 RepID=A0AAJ7RQ25_CEPCN|nr:putative niacin/nicotinamide transporter NaiP isoform X2 [Cephus cinctus]
MALPCYVSTSQPRKEILYTPMPVGNKMTAENGTKKCLEVSSPPEHESADYEKAASAAGMMTTAFLWELLKDRVGRRLPVLYGLLANACCNIIISMLNSYQLIVVLKFVTGFLVTGPLDMLTTYLMEFHGAKNKALFAKWSGILFGLGNILLPALAFYIVPQSWSFTLIQDQLVYNSWRIYLLICSLPSVVGLVTISILPESPLQLMKSGRSDEALKLFKKMYSMNTRKSADTFPIKELLPEEKEVECISVRKRNSRKILKEWTETKVLFSRPNNFIFIGVLFIQFSSMLGSNTLRLWLPQLFSLLGNFVTDYPERGMLTMSETLRYQAMTSPGNQATINSTITCIPPNLEPIILLNSTIITTATVFGAIFAGLVGTESTRRRIILVLTLAAGAASSFGINWGQSVPSMLVMAALIISTARIASDTVNVSSNKVIPNTLRATAGSHVTAVGRLGVVFGSLMFPIFLEIGCLPALMFLGSILTASSVLSIFLERGPTD